MIKNLLRLLISSVTFVAVMLVANITIAQDNSAIILSQPEAISSINSTQETPTIVNLNTMSPRLNSIFQSDTKNHFGCSCEICVQGI